MGTNLVIIVRPFKTQLSLRSLISQSSMGSLWVTVPTFHISSGGKQRFRLIRLRGCRLNIADSARFFLLVDLRELFFRPRVGGTKKIK